MIKCAKNGGAGNPKKNGGGSQESPHQGEGETPIGIFYFFDLARDASGIGFNYNT